jgi:hypothetical protein
MPTTDPPGFGSILFAPGTDAAAPEPPQIAETFRDLNLDRIVDDVAGPQREYDIAPFFRLPLRDVDAIVYRQEVMRDLERMDVLHAIAVFSQRMRRVREWLELANKRFYPRERQRWFLDAAAEYAAAAKELHADLARCELAARGLRAFRDELAAYLCGSGFVALSTEAERLAAGFAAVRFNLRLRGSSVTVQDAGDEADYGSAVAATFAKFRRDESHGKRADRHTAALGLNHVEERILERVARLHPRLFGELVAFCTVHADFVDAGVARFEREVQFYVVWLDHVGKLRAIGLEFCYPQLSATSKEIECRDAFDLALAARLVKDRAPVVRNDFHLRGAERLFVVSGPNQGGKTTFARTFGQLHYLAALGCPVPGTQARLFLCDRVLTHFEREEDATSLRGKLQDDLVRMRRLFDCATSDSIVIMNESFSSTSVQDALYLSREILGRLIRLDALGVCVTFLTELAALGEHVVSAVAVVDPQRPELRTYRVERRPADGLAHALALARKYRLTQADVEERIEPCKRA